MINWEQGRTLRAAVAAGLMVLAMAGCSKGGGAPAAAPPKAAASAITVATAPVVRNDITKTVEVDGSLVALQDVVVGANTAGKLAAVYFHEGDAVTAGQTVAVMDTTELAGLLQQQQANLQTAVTRLQQAQVQVAHARNGVQSAKTTLAYAVSSTATAVKLAQSQLDTAKQKLAVVQQGARAQERQQAQDQVAGAKANFNKAVSDLHRAEDLFNQQAIPQNQLDAAQATYETAQAAYSSAQQALSLIQAGARPEDLRQSQLAVAQARDGLQKANDDRATVSLRREDVHNALAAVDAAVAGARSTAAGVDLARAAVRIAQDNLSKAYIQSPIIGVVAERRAEPGSQVGAGGAVMRIVNPASCYFQANLSESQFHDTHVGQSAVVRVDAIAGKSFAGHVTRVLPVASSAARSFLVRVDITADPRLRPQMFGRGTILVATHKSATLVPKDAAIFDPNTGAATVFVNQNGKAHAQAITVGYSNPQFVEAVTGVKPGDNVVVSGQNTLQNGDPIQVQAQ